MHTTILTSLAAGLLAATPVLAAQPPAASDPTPAPPCVSGAPAACPTFHYAWDMASGCVPGASAGCPTFDEAWDGAAADPSPGQWTLFRMVLANNSRIDAPNALFVIRLGSVRDDAYTSFPIRSTSGRWGIREDPDPGPDVRESDEKLFWTGPLAAGESVAVTFWGIWRGTGDGLPNPTVEYYGAAR